MKRFIFLSVFLLALFVGNTQEILPKHLTPEEIAFVQSDKHIRQVSQQKNAPPGAVRTPAEWEEMQAVIITWQGFSSILSQIVESLIDDVEVYIVCNNESTVKNYLSNQGIDYEGKVSFYEISSNSIWVRDYGPNSAYLEETGELVWIDWIYNRPRYQDNAVPENLGDILNIPVYSTNSAPEDLVNTGGNFMSDGLGYGFSSDLVLEENGAQNQYGFSNHSETEVDEIMKQYMGIENYVKMEALPYDLIHHIDMHMKIIDEETMIIGEYPEGVADGPQIEANIQYILSNFKTAYDRDFNIIRVPMPPEGTKYPDTGGDYRTYANALIANKTIIVPTYEEQYDTTALRIWEEAMPGYNVKGINCDQIIPLSGALHCITKEVAAYDPITIQMKTENTWCPDSPFKWEGTIKSNSEITSAKIFYNVDNQGYNELELTTIDNENYSADLGLFEIGSTIQYYIEVINADNKTINRPFPGAEGPRKTIIVNCNPSSLNELTIETPSVFPNPASAITCIDLKKTYNQLRVVLYDVLGNKVLTINEGASAQKLFFDASDLNSGTYVLRFETDSEFFNYKMIIK
jgi:agmatine/peptidylarginine deiminase